MSEKIYLRLLFFCGILCQGIYATLSDEDSRLSSDLLVRKRRVINHLPGQVIPTRIEDVNYIVKIRENSYVTCAGAILSHYTVITAASCMRHQVTAYSVQSGAAYDNRSNRHNITSYIKYKGNPPYQHEDYEGIALFNVNPPFLFNRKTGHIGLHAPGPLPAGTMVNVFGWGFSYPIQPGWERRQVLHSINLPIMNHGECQHVYQNNHFNINEKLICTYHPQQYCAHGDAGAPLVFSNRLAGIHVWKGECTYDRNPDVFINLQRAEYNAWITEHIFWM